VLQKLVVISLRLSLCVLPSFPIALQQKQQQHYVVYTP